MEKRETYRCRMHGIVAYALSVVVFMVLASLAAANEGPVYPGFSSIDQSRRFFAVVGDTQATLFWEWVVGRERNDRERGIVAREMTSRKPAFVIHLGDLTALGASESHWADFDRLHSGALERGITYLPLIGNHELLGNDDEALSRYFGRFTHLGQRRWYSFTWKSVAFLMLDANLDSLSDEQKARQIAWYAEELARFETDPDIRFIIVSSHIPPYSNSRIINPSADVCRYFAEPFIRSQKGALFLSAHSHSYERFEQGGKTFIVSGGGGGPRQELETDPAKRRYNDLFNGPEMRFFHFCEIEPTDRGIDVRVVALEKGGDGFRIAETVNLPLPGPTTRTACDGVTAKQ